MSSGYVAAQAHSSSRLKLQVLCGEGSYNYDLPGDGSTLIAPLNMGDGSYTFRVMRNTSGSSYVEIASTSANVALESEFAPFLVNNTFVDYDADSDCVAQARELAADAENEGDVVKAVYDWMVANISYDTDKAASLKEATGYVPDPDQTLADGSGICFDYSSLAAAMLRSLGIPCKVITGYVSPDDVYHAWNMVYINGTWTESHIRIDSNTWSLIDTTFAAAGSETSSVGDGNTYTERYTY